MDFLIVDDDFGSRGGMAQTLKGAYPACRVHEASSIQRAIATLGSNPEVSLVLLDLNVDDSRGIETLKALKRWCEETDCNPPVVVVSGGADYDDSLIPEAIEHCATGFITKGTSEEVFRSAIELTLAGSIFIPERYLRSKRASTSKPPVQAEVSFTPREKEVAALLVSGLTYKQIARRLEDREPGRSMSDHTVRVHVQRIAWKLRLNDSSSGESLTARSAVVTAFAEQRLHFGNVGDA